MAKENKFEKNTEYILEQYKLYAQMLDSHSNRFDITNRFFLTINTGILSGLYYITKENLNLGTIVILSILIIILVFCFLWWLVLKFNQKNTSAKYEVLENIEQHLPIQPFYDEWHKHLKGRKKYWGVQKIYQVIPWVFMIIYLLLLLKALYT